MPGFTAVPGIFMVFVTMIAGYESILGNYLPKQLYLLTGLAILVMVLMALVIIGAFRKWYELLQIKTPGKRQLRGQRSLRSLLNSEAVTNGKR